MPWLTIIMTLLSFFAAGGADKEKRAKAALIAAGVGGATYAVTHHTDWGKENLGFLDGVSITENPDGSSEAVTGPGKPPVVLPSPGAVISSQGQNPSSNGFWSTLTGWLSSPIGQASTGVAVGAAVGLPKWMLYLGIGLGAYVLLKD